MSLRSLAIAEDRRRDPVWQALVEELDEVREENRQLKRRLGERADEERLHRLRRQFKLTRQEAALLLALDAAGPVSVDHLHHVILPYGKKDGDVEAVQLVRVVVSHLRAKLKGSAIVIELVSGLGYCLGPFSRTVLQAVAGTPESEAADA